MIDILRGEFIGKYVRIDNKKIEGKIIDETKNNIIVKTKTNVRKKLLKSNQVFQLKINKEFVPIKGDSILMKPEDRIKIKDKD